MPPKTIKERAENARAGLLPEKSKKIDMKQHGIDISKFHEVVSFCKRRNSDPRARDVKKSNVFTKDNVHEFVRKADNARFLPAKVALILGIAGACRSDELFGLSSDAVQEIQGGYLCSISKTKTGQARSFVVKNASDDFDFVGVVKFYIEARKVLPARRFFMQYRGEVYKRTPIWDKREKSHSNRNTLDKCWKEISQEMNVDGNLLRKKWKYLRDQYSVELGKLSALRPGESANEVRTCKWAYFNSLSFLKYTVRPRQLKGNNSRNLFDIEETTSFETEDGLSDEWQPPPNEFVDLTAAGDYEVVEEATNQDETLEINQRKSQKRKLSETDTYNTEIVTIEKDKLELLKEKAAATEHRDLEDEDLLFFKSLLPHVRRIQPSSKLAFRGRIQEIVDQFAYGPI